MFRLPTMLMSKSRETLIVTAWCRSAYPAMVFIPKNMKKSTKSRKTMNCAAFLIYTTPSAINFPAWPRDGEKGHFRIKTTYHQQMVLSCEKMSSTSADQSTFPSYRRITLFSSPSAKFSMNLFSKSSGADRTIFNNFMVNCPLKGNNQVRLFELDQ